MEWFSINDGPKKYIRCDITLENLFLGVDYYYKGKFKPNTFPLKKVKTTAEFDIYESKLRTIKDLELDYSDNIKDVSDFINETEYNIFCKDLSDGIRLLINGTEINEYNLTKEKTIMIRSKDIDLHNKTNSIVKFCSNTILKVNFRQIHDTQYDQESFDRIYVPNPVQLFLDLR